MKYLGIDLFVFIFFRTFCARDLFKKIRGTKGTFHAKMAAIKDRNGMDLTKAEEVARIHKTTIQKRSS